ncbi:MAG TPA: hypothetical protein VFD60_06410 [Nitrososphaeraceae archaeon]|nr:hypothetical protein [Nitrososphaeraceae archaeon]
MSEDNEEIEDVDIFDDNDNELDSNNDQLKTPLERAVEDDDGSTLPVGIVKEEIITVVKNPNSNSETPLVEEDAEEADAEDDDNIYEQLKSHSIQLSRLSDTVESLQSQINLLQERSPGRGSRKTIPLAKMKKRSIKTKKKKTTRRKGSKRSTKK